MKKRKTVLRLVSMLTAIVLCLVGEIWVKPEIANAEQEMYGNFSKNYSYSSDPGQYMLNIANAQTGKTRAQLGYTVDWCAYFISDCAVLANQTKAIPRHGRADYIDGYILNAGGVKVSVSSARAGDIAFYDNNYNNSPDHVEIVSHVSGSNVYTIGGNNGGGNGNVAGVRCHGNILYIIRPNYSGTVPPPSNDDELGIPYPRPQCSSTRWIGEGSVTSGDDVKWVQTALNKANNAGLTVDGVFGTNTENAIKAFQKKYGLTADGQAGTNTINKLVDVIKGSLSLDAPVASLQYATPRTLTFNWNAISGATSYKITFRKSGDEYAVKEENFKGTSYTVTGLEPNTQYYFRVYAKNSSTTSARSETVGGKTPANVDVGTDFFAYITHAKSGKVIGRNSSNNVELQTKNTSNTAQIWKFVKQSDGSYVIYNGLNKEFKGVLDSTGTNTSGSNVYVYDSFVKSNAQYWYIFNTGNAYSFYTKCTDCTMDLNNYNETDGTNIGMATYFGNTAQQYKIEKVSCPHNYGSWTTSKTATCTAEGTQIRKCSICGSTESKTIAKTDHSLGNWTTSKNATCTADGTQVRKCSKCSYSEEKAIAKTGHKYTDDIVAPTCTEKGYTLHTCSSCNDSYKDKETNAKGHTFTSKMIDGYMTYICSDCGYMYTAPFEGEGTAESPFIISNAEELRAVSETVNNTELNSIFGHAYYKQTADIDLENISWIPIGLGYDGEDGKGEYNCTTRMFFGVYDGNQHTIYNLNVENHIAAGLFGCVRNDDAEVCNLVIYGNINSDGDSGGITGGLHYGAKITNCAFIGNVKGDLSVGGIAGYINGGASIINCYNNGNVTGGSNTGGIIGEIAFNQYADNNASAIIENCYHSEGEVSIGNCDLIGNCKYFEGKNNEISINNCYSNYINLTSAIKLPSGASHHDNTIYLSDSLLKKIAEDLGEAYVDNTNSELNNGFPVFPWQLDIMLKGDADSNGVVDINDAVMLQNWLLGSSEELTNWKNVDLCEDGRIDVFDLCLLKRLLVENAE